MVFIETMKLCKLSNCLSQWNRVSIWIVRVIGEKSMKAKIKRALSLAVVYYCSIERNLKMHQRKN